ncbi:BRCA1-associated protein [Sporothrix schenckii 1099-18]|uniref:BRCA1-associated protein n=1 Tax=Sporothrix schenckii 1099-18 TaxID=1397361 RepID=A0A0F2MEA7_SPOSC|nr:BRCA1-associated protein [Sporothrix schenckii 1099-18]KJR88008.1 BRCA1-associated protein [Sporothrix schenckii 1099-18]
MPSSHAYHLTFELYPTPDPRAAPGEAALPPNIWRPGLGASIFDDLPWHATAETTEEDGNGGVDKRTATEDDILAALPERNKNDSRDGIGRSGFSTNSDHSENDGPSKQKTNTINYARTPRQRHTAGLGPETAARDWRFGRVRIASFDMETPQDGATVGVGESQTDGNHNDKPIPAASLGPVLGGAGQSTRGRYNPLATKVTDAGWGIVHLYREGGSTYLSEDADEYGGDGSDGSDGTILCIPAVPSYITPRDFLGFVGETWSRDVSHYRMILTSRTNRYMVLIKFRDSKHAKSWRAAFDGRVLNSMESEICHVAFVKSIAIETPDSLGIRERQMQNADGSTHTTKVTAVAHGGTQPHSKADDTRPSLPPHRLSHSGKEPASLNSLRPHPPPTANLIELPTCPVCLERMDDTAGIMTILCQHVFHCTCLQTWKGSGCPVCRATNPSQLSTALVGPGGSSSKIASGGEAGPSSSGSTNPYDPSNPYSQPFAAGGVSNLCSVCDCADDLWICLICGNVGCGRYKGGHAKEHWKDTMHSFSLELETQHVWDYAGDMWVHRLIRDKGDGKVVELPGRSRGRNRRRGGNRQGGDDHGNEAGEGQHGRRPRNGRRQQDDDDYNDRDHEYDDDADDDDDEEDEEVVPRAKLDRIGLEYTHLLTSQLESQRVYFEELVNKAADKASKAAAAAESAAAQTIEALRELASLRAAHTTLAESTVPALERDVERERRRADKAAELARGLSKSLQDEKRVSEGLMVRIKHVQEQAATQQQQLAAAQAEAAELRETNRDLTMFISGQEKLRELEAEGQVAAGEVEAGTASVPEEKKGKNKGKGRRR